MSVVQPLDAFGAGIGEAPLFDGYSNLAVSVPERDSADYHTVDFFYREHIVVEFAARENLFVYADVLKHIQAHRQALLDGVDGREEGVLEQLEVAVVAVGQVGRHLGDGGFCTLDSVGLGPHNLPYIRVFLVRHDAAAGGQGIRE